MSVVRRDQGTHGYRVLFSPSFFAQLVLDHTYTALERACPQGCCNTQEARPAGRVVRISVLLGLRTFDSHFGRFLQGGGRRVFNLIPTMGGWVLTGREKWNGKGREGQEGKRMERLVKSQDFGVRIIPALKASCLIFSPSVLFILKNTETEDMRESDLIVASCFCHDQ